MSDKGSPLSSTTRSITRYLDEHGRDLSLLVGRLVLAVVFIYHGGGTLFGAFHGPGLHGEAVFFASTAHLHPGMLFAVLGGCVEFFGGVAVGVGLLGRLAAWALVGDMIMAVITVTGGHGIVGNASGSGYELNLALGALALCVALIGVGTYSASRYVQVLTSSSATKGRPVNRAA